MNVILHTDSYKLTHWNQYPEGTETVYSYFESRKDAEFDETVFFGLRPLLAKIEGMAVTKQDVFDAAQLAEAHFGDANLFNFEGWMRIVTEMDGRLPVHIKAVPEGTPVPTGNVLMTVENTVPWAYWLTNHLESLLTHVWYPSTVASLSREVKRTLAGWLEVTGPDLSGLPFMLHDFGYRGVSSDESAAIGGLAHLVNFMGTDTLPAMLLGLSTYGAKLEELAFSVPATEHSVMTAQGRDGELEIVSRLLDEHPTGILSVVGDSFDIYGFANAMGTRFKERILARDGVFVVRPDSGDPVGVTRTLSKLLWDYFGGTTTPAGFKLLDSHVRILWGDGIGPSDIREIVAACAKDGFATANYVFGMGGGLLQKVNRDTQRFAFKSSAQKRNGVWHDIFKRPIEGGKVSKKGRLKLIQRQDGTFDTALFSSFDTDIMETVFINGKMYPGTVPDDFARIRTRAEL